MNEWEKWINAIKESLGNGDFVKLTLSKPAGTSGLLNAYARIALIKNAPMLSITYHYAARDEVRNFGYEEGLVAITEMLGRDFKIGTLFTRHHGLTLRISKKGKMNLSGTETISTPMPGLQHDRQKEKRISSDARYLMLLGIADRSGAIIPRMADKYKQINKYLEVMEGLVQGAKLPDPIQVVDMGAGKGYLTFSLYDYLKNKLNKNVTMVGVEQRQELVDECNRVARECGFGQLHFECSSIQGYPLDKVDVLIALHACDTATDDAIAKGIGANAELIVCAPCCHKQVRQQLKGKVHDNPVLKYGIFKEREFEMVTDTIRALVLERNNYKSNIFEFISSEHTGKNTMLVGVKSKHKPDLAVIQGKIDALKEAYQIDYHYLEKLNC